MKKLLTLTALIALLAFACEQKAKAPAPTDAPVTAPVPTAAVPGHFFIELEGGKVIQVSGNADNWTLTDNGVSCSLSLGGNSYTYAENGQVVAEGKFADGKLKMKTPGGVFFLKIKLKDGKIKLYTSPEEDVQSYDLKFKEDKVKVQKGDTEYGKAKYYPDKGKIKIKDASEKEIASIKGVSGPFAAPAVLLIPDLDQSHKDFALLALCALGK